MSEYSPSELSDILNQQEVEDDKLTELESLIFFWIKASYSNFKSLNTETRIERKPAKDWHREMWMTY